MSRRWCGVWVAPDPKGFVLTGKEASLQRPDRTPDLGFPKGLNPF
jgi:hypothetical protein